MIFRVNRLRFCCVIQVVCFVIATWSILSPPGPHIVFSEQCYARIVVARGGGRSRIPPALLVRIIFNKKTNKP